MPVRIQRSRKKGWKMPAGAVYVGRPTVFGNPFKVSEDVPAERCVKWFYECLERAIYKKPYQASPTGGHLSVETMRRFERMAKRLPELRGKDLVCWCKAGCPCHADSLLEFANAHAN